MFDKKKKSGKPKNIQVDKNVSKRYPNGRTIKTADKYLPIGKHGESDNATILKGRKQGNGKTTYFKHFVEITDNENKPIKIDGKKFIENPWGYDLDEQQIIEIQNKVYKHSTQATENKKKIADLKASDGKNKIDKNGKKKR